MPSFSARSDPAVVVVTFDDAKLLDIAGPLQVFADARHHGGPAYRTALVSLDGGASPTDTGLALTCEGIDAWRDRAIDTLLVAGGPGARGAAEHPALIAAVLALAGRARRVGSICTGAFVLAATGLLDGRNAVTHWESCHMLALCYPAVSVEPDRLFVQDDSVWTSAGVTAGIDMALAMVAEDAGRAVALRLARSLVAFMARPGGQSQFSEVLNQQTHDATGRFDALHAWIAEHLDQDLRIDRLAERAGMSPRNFARLYTKHTGQTPAKAIELFRVAAARQRLEETEERIATIARKTGFFDEERLRRAMLRVLGTTPKEYRARFGKRATLRG